jgi:hypothetical protein
MQNILPIKKRLTGDVRRVNGLFPQPILYTKVAGMETSPSVVLIQRFK